MGEPKSPMLDLTARLGSLASELLAFMRHATGDEHLGADLTQEALVKALRNLHQFREGSSLRGWVFRIALNTFHDHLRKKRPEDLSPSDLDGHVAQGETNPLSHALKEELHSQLRHQLMHLPERQRSVLLLHGVKNLSHDEIADTLGITKEAVKTALYHGRRSLSARLDRYLERSMRTSRRTSS
jgi:RNA polymerase sigma-70 factor (ECF subfamily)